MEKDNSKVPVAILSCFLIAFILQGVLKLCGVFVFEKALDWEIFKLIDNNKCFSVIYYSIIMIITMHCLSYSLTTKIYSNKWYHYLIIISTAFIVTTIRSFAVLDYSIQIILDILVYVIVPLIIKFTMNQNDLIFEKDFYNQIIMVVIQISLYFCYLGLTYWSSLLTSLVIINPMWVSSSCQFLVRFEIYIGLIAFTISTNVLSINLKRRANMLLPVDIASEEAKIAELEEKKVEKK